MKRAFPTFQVDQSRRRKRMRTVLRGGRFSWNTGLFRGATDLNELPAALLESDGELLAAILEALPTMLMVFDRTGKLLRVNRSFQSIAGYSPDAIEHLHFSSLFADSSAQSQWQTALACKNLNAIECNEYLTNRAGRRVPLELALVRVGEAADLRIVVGAIDLRSQRTTERHLIRQAYFDALTRLPNRTGFKHQLALRIAGSFQRDEDSLAVAVVDVARFRVINDAIGHDGGDALLQSLASRLQSNLQDVVIGHLSAGEFAVMLTDVRNERDALRVGQRILGLFREAFLVRGQRIVLNARVGVALADARSDPATVMRDADSALFEAKESAQGVRVFDRSMRLASEARLRLDIELRAAVARDEFRLVLQPIVRVQDGTLVGHEALVRWAHPTAGELLPAQFIAHAERSGVISAIDAWSLRATLEWLEDTRTGLSCNVNTSALSLLDQVWLNDAVRLLEEHSEAAKRLRIEITETALLGDAQITAAALERLIGAGAQIVLDDFGTGYSSLVHLQSFPISGIKVDRSFLARLDSDRRDQTIVAALIGLASELGLTVTAEGVETETQRACLIEHGCEFAQGYLFGRPAPAAATLQHSLGAIK